MDALFICKLLLVLIVGCICEVNPSAARYNGLLQPSHIAYAAHYKPLAAPEPLSTPPVVKKVQPLHSKHPEAGSVSPPYKHKYPLPTKDRVLVSQLPVLHPTIPTPTIPLPKPPTGLPKPPKPPVALPPTPPIALPPIPIPPFK